MIGFNKIEKTDLKVGNILKAHWDGANHKITKVEDNIVSYTGLTYDGDWKDKIDVMLKCFDLVELQHFLIAP